MNNQQHTNSLGFPVEKLVEAKGRGVIQTVAKTTLKDSDSTIISDKVKHVFVSPQADSFVVIAKPSIEYKEKQTVVIMSKFVLKSLKAAHNAPREQISSNAPRYNEEFARKWGVRPQGR
jgi:dihydroxyacetone kinase-like predicted kinase